MDMNQWARMSAQQSFMQQQQQQSSPLGQWAMGMTIPQPGGVQDGTGYVSVMLTKSRPPANRLRVARHDHAKATGTPYHGQPPHHPQPTLIQASTLPHSALLPCN